MDRSDVSFSNDDAQPLISYCPALSACPANCSACGSSIGPYRGEPSGLRAMSIVRSFGLMAALVVALTASAVLTDVSLSMDLLTHPKITVLRGPLPDNLAQLPSASLDVILCISVLEHLWEPAQAIREFHRLLAPGGVCLLNVPSWRGKRFLEYSAFRLGLSPADEMNDHKNYYDVKDLWPLLVRGGFKPSGIRCFHHKFGMNTFAICRTPR